MSLYHRIQRVKENPDTERAGSYWSPEEDIKLLENIKNNKALAEIALDHKRTSGSIEIRIRGLAYLSWKKIKNTCLDSSILIEKISNEFRIPSDELTIYIRDKEKYSKEKDEKNIEKSIEKKKQIEIKENERLAALEIKKEKEREREREKREAMELREKERSELLALREAEKLKILQEKKQLLDEKELLKQKTLEEKERLREEKQKILELKEKEREENEEMEEQFNYIYCIKEREFVRSGENIYKVGKTTVHPFKRMKQYPNGSKIILILKVNDCHVAERELLKYLDKKFKSGMYQNKRIGREYYDADETEIIKHIMECINEFY